MTEKTQQVNPRVSIPVTLDFLHQFRLIAAAHNMGLARYGREILERAVSKYLKENSIVIKKLEKE